MKDYRFLQQKYLVNTYRNRGLTFVGGEGVFLLDASGEKYLDLMANYGVSIFGYSPPRIMEALREQMAKLIVLHGSFNNDARAEAAESLVKRCGNGLSQVYFSNSGSEAVEAALKFAVLATGKKKFIVCRNGYHGKTLGALSATSAKAYRNPFEPLLWTFKAIEYDDGDQLEAVLEDEIAAVLLEPIQGEGGVNVPKPGYLKKVKDACQARDILMILDEIQTGTGRTGYFLASEADRAAGDILCLGKGLAGGLPIGATLISPKVAEKIPKGIHTSTFGGNPLALAGVSATLELLDEVLLKDIREKGTYFLERLQSIDSEVILEVRGRGLMIGVEVKGMRDAILQNLQKEHILAAPAGDNVIRFLPPYILEENHIDCVTEAVTMILKRLEEEGHEPQQEKFPASKEEKPCAAS